MQRRARPSMPLLVTCYAYDTKLAVTLWSRFAPSSYVLLHHLALSQARPRSSHEDAQIPSAMGRSQRIAQLIAPCTGPLANGALLPGMQAQATTAILSSQLHHWRACAQNSVQFIKCRPSWQLAPLRGFASSGLGQQSVSIAAEVLDQTQIVKLREQLELEADNHLSIPYTRFVEIAKASGARTDTEAAEQCTVLHKSGIVLRHQDVVYLRAQEVADMVMMMLPGGKDDAQAMLTQVESELVDMEREHALLERRSNRWVNAILVTGLCILATQFVMFIWLTWWELSWDVMEPIAYIIGLFYSLVAYIYFLFTRHTFDLGPIQQFWSKRFKTKAVTDAQFDATRYEYLKKLQQRYKRHLASVRVR